MELIIILLVIAVFVGYGIKTWWHNNKQPIIAHDVIVSYKHAKTPVFGWGRGYNREPSITFEFIATGEIKEFQPPIFDSHVVREAKPGDRYILKLKGTRWILCDKVKTTK